MTDFEESGVCVCGEDIATHTYEHNAVDSGWYFSREDR